MSAPAVTSAASDAALQREGEQPLRLRQDVDDDMRVSVWVSAYHAIDVAEFQKERAFLHVASSGWSVGQHLTPDQARELAAHLQRAADFAEANRARRESFDEIREDMRQADEDGRDTGCLYGHPDVHYVPASQMQDTLRNLGHRRGIVIADEHPLDSRPMPLDTVPAGSAA